MAWNAHIEFISKAFKGQIVSQATALRGYTQPITRGVRRIQQLYFDLDIQAGEPLLERGGLASISEPTDVQAGILRLCRPRSITPRHRICRLTQEANILLCPPDGDSRA